MKFIYTDSKTGEQIVGRGTYAIGALNNLGDKLNQNKIHTDREDLLELAVSAVVASVKGGVVEASLGDNKFIIEFSEKN